MKDQLYVIVNSKRSPLELYNNDSILLLLEITLSSLHRVLFYRSQSILSQGSHTHFIRRAMPFCIRPDFDGEKTCLSKKRSCIIADPQKKKHLHHRYKQVVKSLTSEVYNLIVTQCCHIAENSGRRNAITKWEDLEL
jgi:hypothetical protein